MMARQFSKLCLALAVTGCLPTVSVLAAPPLAQSPAAALLAQPATLRGTLGTQPVQMHLQLKVPADEGVEGNYFLFGQTHKILLAGETDNDVLALEESENGSDISGLWDGKIAGRSVRGTWSSADGSVSKPFELTVVPDAALASKSRSGKKAMKVIAARPVADQH
jgi:hypothetical protein